MADAMSPIDALQERMAAGVVRALHTNPRMQPLLRGSLSVQHGADFLEAVAIIDGHPYMVRLLASNWWIAGVQTMEQRAEELASRLAAELRRGWERNHAW